LAFNSLKGVGAIGVGLDLVLSETLTITLGLIGLGTNIKRLSGVFG